MASLKEIESSFYLERYIYFFSHLLLFFVFAPSFLILVLFCSIFVMDKEFGAIPALIVFFILGAPCFWLTRGTIRMMRDAVIYLKSSLPSSRDSFLNVNAEIYFSLFASRGAVKAESLRISNNETLPEKSFEVVLTSPGLWFSSLPEKDSMTTIKGTLYLKGQTPYLFTASHYRFWLRPFPKDVDHKTFLGKMISKISNRVRNLREEKKL